MGEAEWNRFLMQEIRPQPQPSEPRTVCVRERLCVLRRQCCSDDILSTLTYSNRRVEVESSHSTRAHNSRTSSVWGCLSSVICTHLSYTYLPHTHTSSCTPSRIQYIFRNYPGKLHRAPIYRTFPCMIIKAGLQANLVFSMSS